MTDLRIAYLTAHDPSDRSAWSGTIHAIGAALRRHCGSVTPLGPLPRLDARIDEALSRCRRASAASRYAANRSVAVALAHACVASSRLRQVAVDLVISPMRATEIAYLATRVPIVLVSDAPFPLLEDYYPEFTGLSYLSRFEAQHLERRAAARARLQLYPTHWAARGAVERVGADPRRIHVISFGANLADPPSPRRRRVRRPGDPVRLLLVGKDWHRKGGAVAVATLDALASRGIRAELTVCGCAPNEAIRRPDVRSVPFLDVTSLGERRRLESLYRGSDLMLLPARQECFGIVFCEAAAFGVPVVTSDTGGVSEVVRDGMTGFVLSRDAQPQDYAEAIARLAHDPARLERMSRSAREEYERRLNWDAWGKAVAPLLHEVASSGARSLAA